MLYNARMSDIIKRVAQAICKSRACEGWACCQWPGNRGRLACPVEAGGYDDAARAAIETPPTGEMINAMAVVIREREGRAVAITAQLAWDAAVQVALGNSPVAERGEALK